MSEERDLSKPVLYDKDGNPLGKVFVEKPEEENTYSIPKFKTYTFTGTYGIDDIWGLNPWANSHDWPYWAAHFNYTEEEYNKNPKAYEARIKERNEAHIEMLKQTGKYLTKYETYISMVHNPLFDDNKIDNGLRSHGMLIPRGDGDTE